MNILQKQIDNELSNFTLIALESNQNLENNLKSLESRYQLSSGVLQNNFKAEAKEVFHFLNHDNHVVLLGLGKKPGFAEYLKAFRIYVHQNKNKLNGDIAIETMASPENLEWSYKAALNGVLLGGYCIKLYKADKNGCAPFNGDKITKITLQSDAKNDNWNQWIEETRQISETQMSIFDLVNSPSNKKYPQILADWAKNSGDKNGYQVEIFDKDQCEKKGLEALLAVSKGSENPPVFIIAQYLGNPGGPTIGLVGKGVTFDTGGISLKPSANMHMMKSDMGGAAAVLGTIDIAAKMKLNVNLVAIVPSTENTVDGLAIKPGDVIGSYSGKTIEVIDTDAEGRLILADGLSYIVKNFNPQIIIDLATLTGNCIMALGSAAAAMFTLDNEISTSLENLGHTFGEKVWRMPLWDIYKEDMQSDIADIKNLSGKPVAGAITAAKFLEYFTEEHPKWVHLDIAGVAYTDNEFSMNRSGTSWGIRLLFEFLKTQTKK